MNMRDSFAMEKVLISVYHTMPLYFIVALILKVSAAVIPLIQIKINAQLLDIILMVYQRHEYLNHAFSCGTILILLIAFQWGLDKLFLILSIRIKNQIEKNEDLKVIEKVNLLPYSKLEELKTQNLINRIKKNSVEKIHTSVLQLYEFLRLLIKILGIVFIIYSTNRICGMIILVFSIPMIIFAMKGGKKQYTLTKELTEQQRYADYLSELMICKDTSYERELFNFVPAINCSWKKLTASLIKEKAIVKWKWFIKTKISGLFMLGASVASGFILLFSLFNDEMTTGMYIAIMSALIEMVSMMNLEFATFFDEMASNREFFKEYQEFYLIESIQDVQTTLEMPNEIHMIEFRDVSFTYPGSNKKVLDSISFRMERGKSYALVGRNGAGKSTIVKLLLRLYDDYTGDILINGINICEISKQSYLEKFSVVFQDFSRFPISFKENVVLTEDNVDSKRWKSVVKQLDLEMISSKLQAGFDTELGKIYSDEDLSGGEWQRLAIARALYKNADIQILDEPTAALDPVNESLLYKMFQHIIKKDNKLSLVITHRLGSSKESDNILVVNQGRISESGSFHELMQRRGEYYDMYEMQKSWYQDT